SDRGSAVNSRAAKVERIASYSSITGLLSACISPRTDLSRWQCVVVKAGGTPPSKGEPDDHRSRCRHEPGLSCAYLLRSGENAPDGRAGVRRRPAEVPGPARRLARRAGGAASGGQCTAHLQAGPVSARRRVADAAPRWARRADPPAHRRLGRRPYHLPHLASPPPPPPTPPPPPHPPP